MLQTSSPAAKHDDLDESIQEVDENDVEASSSVSVNPKQEEEPEETSSSEAVAAEPSSTSPKEPSKCDVNDDELATQWSAIVERDDELRKRPAADEPPTTPVAASGGSRKPTSPAAAAASPEAGVKHCRENAAHASARDDLDAAVQKLESMRLGDKQSAKRKSNPSKRHSTAKDAAVAAVAAAAEAECSKGGQQSAGKSKLPSSIASQLTSPSSKIKKRKSRKKSKGGAGGAGAPGDEIVHNCKSSPSDSTPAAVSNACDARKGFDPCGRTSPSAKSAFRMCLPDNEKLLRNSTENDSLR